MKKKQTKQTKKKCFNEETKLNYVEKQISANFDIMHLQKVSLN